MVYSDPFVHLSVIDSHINYDLPKIRRNSIRTENEYCNMSFEDYMKLKNNPSPCYFTKKAIRQYEMWLENVSNRIQRIRQKHKVQSNVNTTPSKPHYIYNQQKNINTFLTPPFLKKPVQYQRYYSQ